jgi:hypothetical protein
VVEIDSSTLKVKSNLLSSNKILNKDRKTKGADDKRNFSRSIHQVKEKKRKKRGLSRTDRIVAGVAILIVVMFLVGFIVWIPTLARTPYNNNVLPMGTACGY